MRRDLSLGGRGVQSNMVKVRPRARAKARAKARARARQGLGGHYM